MPVGVIINVLAVAIGGTLGALMGNRIPVRIKDALNMIFGLCAMCMGISSTVLMVNMPAVVFSVILGTLLGMVVGLGDWIRSGATLLQRAISGFAKAPEGMPEKEFMSTLITIVVLFCASGTGIYGTIVSGMSGDHSILIAKSILDIFTAMIFGCSLGMIVSFIALPQLVIFMILFVLAKIIYPLTTPAMIGDFKAAGGFLLVATGLRMLKLKEFPVADMLPAMLLVLPVSALWTNIIMPLIS